MGCEDGRNWFAVDYAVNDDEMVRAYTLDGNGDTLWVQPSALCPGSVNRLEFLQADAPYSDISDAYIWDDMLHITVGNQFQHPIMRDHYRIENTGNMTRVDYPFADIVTEELTESLGLTDRVFGEDSQRSFSLNVSPDGERILYFLPGRMIDQCAHFCYWMDAYVANADGSDARYLAEVPTEASLIRVYWGTDGRIYFTHITETSPIVFTVAFCIDDACELEGNIDDMIATFVATVTSATIPTTSPSGRYLALSPIYPLFLPDEIAPIMNGPTIIDLETGNVIQLPDNGLTGMPIFFETEAETRIMVGIGGDYVTDSSAYPFELDGDVWVETWLNFEDNTYNIGYSVLNNTLETNAFFGFNWDFNWVHIQDTRRAYRALGVLDCLEGGFG